MPDHAAALGSLIARNVITLIVERRRAVPFARFRTKLVAALVGMTLIPSVLVLIVGSEVIRNSAERWFSAPIDDVLTSARAIARSVYVDPEARALLHGYRWPGNVRELRNVIERVVIMVPRPVVTARDLAFLATTPLCPDLPPVEPQRPARLQDARDQFERDYIVQALTEQRGNITRTAEALGMERSNLHRKMRSFGIRSPR